MGDGPRVDGSRDASAVHGGHDGDEDDEGTAVPAGLQHPVVPVGIHDGLNVVLGAVVHDVGWVEGRSPAPRWADLVSTMTVMAMKVLPQVSMLLAKLPQSTEAAIFATTSCTMAMTAMAMLPQHTMNARTMTAMAMLPQQAMKGTTGREEDWRETPLTSCTMWAASRVAPQP